MQREFHRLAIVNRGEAAMRAVHAVRELNRERGSDIATIALFAEPERHAMFVRESDEGYCIGPSTFVDPVDGTRKSAYFDLERLEEALVATRADAAWVGWGLVAEEPAFVDLCTRLGIVFVGPGAEAMRILRDKIEAKRLAERCHVHVAPWSGGPVSSLDEARQAAARVGYPIAVKVSAGVRRQIRPVRDESELASAFELAAAEAAQSGAAVYFERLFDGARHVEVQVVADGQGSAWAVGVRDCSLQLRHRKVVDESSSVALDEDQNRALEEASVRLFIAAGYRNAGTVEFLYDPVHKTFSFVGVNARLQAEHPVTELTSGLDLVKLQLHIAAGGRLEGSPPRPSGHAVEARLYAVDGSKGFTPAPGRVALYRVPYGPGVRVETGVEEGDHISPDGPPLVSKIVAYGRDRHEAIARLRRAIAETVVVVEGGTTNKSFLMKLLEQPQLISGDVTVGWLDRLAAEGDEGDQPYADVALVEAAIDVYESELAIEEAAFYRSALRLRPAARPDIGHTADLVYRGNAYSIGVRKLDGRHYRVEVDGHRADVAVDRLSPYERRVRFGARSFRVVNTPEGHEHVVEVDGVAHRVARGDRGIVRAQAPAVVVSFSVEPGKDVAAGDCLATLEAMKMEVRVLAPFPGRVKHLLASTNVQVNAGDPLLQVEPASEAATIVHSGPRVSFSALDRASAPAGGAACDTSLEELRRLLLGFDVDPAEAKRLADGLARAPRDPHVSDETLRCEDRLLQIFVDICSIFPRQPTLDEPEADEMQRAERYLVGFLRSFDDQDRAIPRAFIDALRRAVGHYGVAKLARTPELQEVMLWIFKSRQRVDQQLAPIASILSRRLEAAADLTPRAGAGFRDLLDDLIAVTQGFFPTVNDLAREVRYAFFDRPQYDAAREAVLAGADAALDRLAEDPDAPGRGALVAELVECPQPIFAHVLERMEGFGHRMRQTGVEVMLRRYYRVRALGEFRAGEVDGLSFATSSYTIEGRSVEVFGLYARDTDLAAALAAIAPVLAKAPADRDVALDCYLWREGPRDKADDTARAFETALDAAGFARAVRRVVVAVAGVESHGLGMTGFDQFTFEPTEEGRFKENMLHRGLHPMLAERLHMSALSNFTIERLPSAEDVFLFKGVAKENPKDERLFAIAEVRDLTPTRDAAGRVVALPHLERMLLEALGGIRLEQAKRKPSARLQWNRVLLFLWPTLDLPRSIISQVASRLAPATQDLGLDEVVVRCRIPSRSTGEPREAVIRIKRPAGKDVVITFAEPSGDPIHPISSYDQKVVRLRRIGLTYPYEIVKLLTPATSETVSDFPSGEFVEHDLGPDGTTLVPVDRPYGQNTSNIITGVIRNFTEKYPEGMARVMLLGDPSREMGSLAESECRRIIAGLDLAEKMRVPLEWFPVSAGAKISMESGTENMDWISRVLRRIIEFTQRGGEINLVVNGINVGAQPYWNAEATMLMHTRGILIMTPEAAMVLTGKRALDFSGSVSADDNFGIGGYERVMGPNGQAQYWARDIGEATHILLRHYEHTYVVPGERFPRRSPTTDPIDRDVRSFPHDGGEFRLVGEVFSDAKNAGRKKPFDIRSVMRAVSDQDREPLERWGAMRDAEISVVWDAHVGGYPVCMIGFESHPVPRLGFVPADGPEAWTSGTLFPQASRKTARAINAASGNRPLVVLANLSGFDGSPESMRKWQLEYGAEIGRAVTNFNGPIVFVVVSRYHGGAFVVFSKTLNENMKVVALEGTYASVIGGAPAAAVVFSREVDTRTANDERLKALELEITGTTDEAEKRRLRARAAELHAAVHSEKLGQVAEEFDAVHSVRRALDVGSLDGIIPARDLRPFVVAAIEQGVAQTLGGAASRTARSER